MGFTYRVAHTHGGKRVLEALRGWLKFTSQCTKEHFVKQRQRPGVNVYQLLISVAERDLHRGFFVFQLSGLMHSGRCL